MIAFRVRLQEKSCLMDNVCPNVQKNITKLKESAIVHFALNTNNRMFRSMLQLYERL